MTRSIRAASALFGIAALLAACSPAATAATAAPSAVRAAFPDPWIRQYSVKANDVPAIVVRDVRDKCGGAFERGASLSLRVQLRIGDRQHGVRDRQVRIEYQRPIE